MEKISIDYFRKLDIRVGRIVAAEDIKGSKKLLRLEVDVGEEKPRQILAGIKEWYRPEELVGKYVVILANLKPKKMLGLESQGMLLMAEEEEGKKPVFLIPEEPVKPGTKVR